MTPTKTVGISVAILAIVVALYFGSSRSTDLNKSGAYATSSETQDQPVDFSNISPTTKTDSLAQSNSPASAEIKTQINLPASSQGTQIFSNSPSCLEMAKSVLQGGIDSGNILTGSVLQAHFLKKTGACYYEITAHYSNGEFATVIDWGPQDYSIVSCINSSHQPFTGDDAGTRCYSNNQTLTTEEYFYGVEHTYLES